MNGMIMIGQTILNSEYTRALLSWETNFFFCYKDKRKNNEKK